MNTRFFSTIRNGAIAFGLAAALALPASATPLGSFTRTAAVPEAAEAEAMPIHYRRYNRRYDCYRYGGCGYYGSDWRYRHYRPYYGGLYLGLGVPAYRYYAPQRRYYRGLNSAHIRWCYNRYRSYREWDNTFQPYHGPRRQCWSPYS